MFQPFPFKAGCVERRVMSFQLNYCIMLFVIVSSAALLHCTANVNLTNTRCALDYLRLDSPYCALCSHKQTHHAKFLLSFHSKSQRFVQISRLIQRQKFACIDMDIFIQCPKSLQMHSRWFKLHKCCFHQKIMTMFSPMLNKCSDE